MGKLGGKSACRHFPLAKRGAGKLYTYERDQRVSFIWGGERRSMEGSESSQEKEKEAPPRNSALSSIPLERSHTGVPY